MRKFLLTISLAAFVFAASAQQLHFTSQYLLHNAMYNPGAAGISDRSFVGMTYRSMWSSFPGNPKTFMVYGDTRWEKMNSGVAAYLYRDVTGPTNRTGIQLAYSYHVKTGQHSKLGLGLEIRGLQYAIDRLKLAESLENDLVLSGANSKFKLDGGAGAYFTNGSLSIGAAVSQLIQSKLSFSDVQNATERAKLYRHYNINANYVFATADDIKVIPNAMMRIIPNSPTEFDFGCKIDYRDQFWWALNYRIRQFWSVQAGFKLMERVRFGYSYDYYSAPFSDYNSGGNAHEISLQFDLKKK